jgi:hypothetical protein
MASTVILDAEAHKLRYIVYMGVDRSSGNADGYDPIVFSKEYDNLTNSDYQYVTATEKNAALIGGAGEGTERFYSLVAGWQSDIERREMWVDASSVNRTYKDDNDAEQTYPDDEYRAMLDAQGKQNLQTQQAAETFNGAIDITNSQWKYNEDFALGDIVTIQNNDIDKYVNVRLLEVLEVQDANGYSIEATTQT